MSTILISGGSKGIGLEVAKLFAKLNYDICITYNKDSKSAKKALQIIKKTSKNSICIKADFGKKNDIDKVFKKLRKLSRLEILVNNAAINVDRVKFEKISLQKVKKIFDINYFGCFYSSQLAFKIFKKQNKKLNKNIINLSSQAAIYGGNMFTHYAPTKAAINTLTKGLSREAAQYNIRVNAISPGIIMTEGMLRVNKKNLKAISRSIPLKRIGTPKEVAKIIMQITSDHSKSITGSIIPIAGGR